MGGCIPRSHLFTVFILDMHGIVNGLLKMQRPTVDSENPYSKFWCEQSIR